MTTVVRSEKEVNLDGASQDKYTKAEDSGIGVEEIDGVLVRGEADTERQLPEDPEEGTNAQYLERDFLILIESCDFRVMPELRSTCNLVIGRQSAKFNSSVEVLNTSEKIALF